MKFSIITPSLNQGRFLGECLDSVRAQRAPKPEGCLEVEHIVVDGGSTDESLPLLKGRLDVTWISEPDGGQSDAINKGLKLSSGEILAYLCADDFYEPGTLAEVERIFAAHPDVDVVYGDYYFMEGASRWKRLKCAGPFSVERLRKGNFLGQPSVFWRLRVRQKFGGFDAGLKYCMDHEYWLRICKASDWHYLQEPLATCRLHLDSKTSSQLVAMWEEAAVMGERYGVGCTLKRQAWRMRMGGQWYYWAKRRIFEWIGKYINRKGK